jgi:hypothetical protein
MYCILNIRLEAILESISLTSGVSHWSLIGELFHHIQVGGIVDKPHPFPPRNLDKFAVMMDHSFSKVGTINIPNVQHLPRMLIDQSNT